MTQPDKWKDTAERLALDAVSYEGGHYDDSPGSCDVDIEAIATALRAAHAEGERAGIARLEPTDAMTLAGAKALFGDIDEDDDYFVRRFRVGLEAAIRTAKETKE